MFPPCKVKIAKIIILSRLNGELTKSEITDCGLETSCMSYQNSPSSESDALILLMSFKNFYCAPNIIHFQMWWQIRKELIIYVVCVPSIDI